MHKHRAFGVPIDALEVVVIDDSESMLAILRTILHAFGVAEAHAFADGEEALSFMISRPPHVVITDLQMRPMDGIQLMRAMRHRQLDPLCRAAMLVISGYGARSLVRQAFAAGANQFLVKPISPASLYKRLEWLTQDSQPLKLVGEHYVVDRPDAPPPGAASTEEAAEAGDSARVLTAHGAL